MSVFHRRGTQVSAPIRKARVSVEQLEDRLVPAITFASYSTGTFAFNSNTGAWRKITTVLPKAMDEGADGCLFASYASGTYRYNYWSNGWTKLTGAVTSVLSAASDNTLVASFNSGVWEYDSTWHQITVAIANKVAVSYDNYFFASFGYVQSTTVGPWGNGSTVGTYLYNTVTGYTSGDPKWTRLTTAVAGNMDASASGRLFASYNKYAYDVAGKAHLQPLTGTWMYVGTSAQRIDPNAATNISVVSGTDVYFTFLAGTLSGTWHMWSSGHYSLVSGVPAKQIGADSDALIASFNSGTWEIINGGWHKIWNLQPTFIA